VESKGQIRRKEMKIEIEYKKVVVKGEKHVQITDVEALSWGDLPVEYTTALPYCFEEEAGFLTIRDTNGTFYLDPREGEEDNTVPEFELQKRIVILRECAKRLKAINLKKEVERWKGEVTLSI
jgi:hypothetical protein